MNRAKGLATPPGLLGVPIPSPELNMELFVLRTRRKSNAIPAFFGEKPTNL